MVLWVFVEHHHGRKLQVLCPCGEEHCKDCWNPFVRNDNWWQKYKENRRGTKRWTQSVTTQGSSLRLLTYPLGRWDGKTMLQPWTGPITAISERRQVAFILIICCITNKDVVAFNYNSDLQCSWTCRISWVGGGRDLVGKHVKQESSEGWAERETDRQRNKRKTHWITGWMDHHLTHPKWCNQWMRSTIANSLFYLHLFSKHSVQLNLNRSQLVQ